MTARARANRNQVPRHVCCRRLATRAPSIRPTHMNQKSIIVNPWFCLVWCNVPAVEGCRSACHSLCAKLRTSLR